MSQHDLSIADQSAPLFRADLNNALAALGSLQSGGTAPALPYNSLLWYDTATDILKIGNEAGDAFYPVGYMDNSAGSFNIIDGMPVSTTAGVVVGSLSAQTQATWNSGVGTTETLISPAKLKAAVEAHAPSQSTTYLAIGTYTTAWNSSASSISAGANAPSSVLRISTNRAAFSTISVTDSNVFPTSYTSVLAGTWQAMSFSLGRTSSFDAGTGQTTYFWNPSIFIRVA
jgi:hypothetical protein